MKIIQRNLINPAPIRRTYIAEYRFLERYVKIKH